MIEMWLKDDRFDVCIPIIVGLRERRFFGDLICLHNPCDVRSCLLERIMNRCRSWYAFWFNYCFSLQSLFGFTYCLYMNYFLHSVIAVCEYWGLVQCLLYRKLSLMLVLFFVFLDITFNAEQWKIVWHIFCFIDDSYLCAKSIPTCGQFASLVTKCASNIISALLFKDVWNISTTLTGVSHVIHELDIFLAKGPMMFVSDT